MKFSLLVLLLQGVGMVLAIIAIVAKSLYTINLMVCQTIFLSFMLQCGDPSFLLAVLYSPPSGCVCRKSPPLIHCVKFYLSSIASRRHMALFNSILAVKSCTSVLK